MNVRVDPKKMATVVATMLGGLLFLSTIADAGQVPAPQIAGNSALMSRVGPPSAGAVNEFGRAGMEHVRPHELTADERANISAALNALPSLNRDALDKHLHQLAFVDGLPGEGTGLTSLAKGGQFDITLRASLIHESLSTFLTNKERRVFTDDGTGTTVTITGTGTDAFTYVLLHESSHVLDAACGIVEAFPNSFDRGIWFTEHQANSELASSLATQTYFHGGPKLPVRQAPEVYDSLSTTPFVSLYSTASAREDFTELVAWCEIQQLYGGMLTIRVNKAPVSDPREWHPLAFPAVEDRLVQIDRLESQKESCPIVRKH